MTNKIPKIGEYWQYDKNGVYQIVNIDSEGYPVITGVIEYCKHIINHEYCLTVKEMSNYKFWKQYFFTPKIIDTYEIF